MEKNELIFYTHELFPNYILSAISIDWCIAQFSSEMLHPETDEKMCRIQTLGEAWGILQERWRKDEGLYQLIKMNC